MALGLAHLGERVERRGTDVDMRVAGHDTAQPCRHHRVRQGGQHIDGEYANVAVRIGKHGFHLRRHLIGHLLQRLDRAVAQVGIFAAEQRQQAVARRPATC